MGTTSIDFTSSLISLDCTHVQKVSQLPGGGGNGAGHPIAHPVNQISVLADTRFASHVSFMLARWSSR